MERKLADATPLTPDSNREFPEFFSVSKTVRLKHPPFPTDSSPPFRPLPSPPSPRLQTPDSRLPPPSPFPPSSPPAKQNRRAKISLHSALYLTPANPHNPKAPPTHARFPPASATIGLVRATAVRAMRQCARRQKGRQGRALCGGRGALGGVGLEASQSKSQGREVQGRFRRLISTSYSYSCGTHDGAPLLLLRGRTAPCPSVITASSAC